MNTTRGQGRPKSKFGDGDSSARSLPPAHRQHKTRPPTGARQRETNRGQTGRDKGKEKGDTSLNLSGAPLLASPSFAQHPNLRKLDLSNCGLSSLSFVRDFRRSLTWLNVSGNNLGNPDAWDGVNELSGLFVLNASQCQLTEVPSVIEVLHSLKALVMTHNSLRKLDHVKNLRDLNTIVVSNNELVSLPSNLSTLPSLKKISAAHNKLTADALPDMSSLAHLKEVKLNDNRTLKALPPHFRSWGRGNQVGSDQSKRPPGLEIVDFGNCGFEDWYALKELAGQSGIVNLSLKGTKVAEEALEADGFEAFKSKIKILLPLLRILDGNRFDAKFQDLKARREARAPEEKVLDAGPMGLAINAAKENPVEIPRELVEKREKDRREREMQRRRERSGPKQPAVSLEGEADALAMDVDHGPAKDVESPNEVPQDAEDSADEAAPVPVKKKRNKKRKPEPTEDSEAPTMDQEQGADGGGKKKKRKNRHEARREAEEPSSAKVSTTASSSQGTAEQTSEKHDVLKNVTSADAEPRKKRGRISKDPARAALAPREPKPTQAQKPKKERRSKGSLLAELQGDGSESAAAVTAPIDSPVPVAEEAPPASKQKTSVLKVVEVQKKKDKRGKSEEKADVGSLLGLGTTPAPLGAASTSMFGSGWD